MITQNNSMQQTNLPFSQLIPNQALVQSHVYLPNSSLQVPSLRHGLDSHSLFSSTKNDNHNTIMYLIVLSIVYST